MLLLAIESTMITIVTIILIAKTYLEKFVMFIVFRIRSDTSGYISQVLQLSNKIYWVCYDVVHVLPIVAKLCLSR